MTAATEVQSKLGMMKSTPEKQAGVQVWREGGKGCVCVCVCVCVCEGVWKGIRGGEGVYMCMWSITVHVCM